MNVTLLFIHSRRADCNNSCQTGKKHGRPWVRVIPADTAKARNQAFSTEQRGAVSFTKKRLTTVTVAL